MLCSEALKCFGTLCQLMGVSFRRSCLARLQPSRVSHFAICHVSFASTVNTAETMPSPDAPFTMINRRECSFTPAMMHSDGLLPCNHMTVASYSSLPNMQRKLATQSMIILSVFSFRLPSAFQSRFHEVCANDANIAMLTWLRVRFCVTLWAAMNTIGQAISRHRGEGKD